ncbi:MAG: substrate-binding domain-containing protein, partial [Alphaproteobacteria bacterium]|nr:substrate-binding domain-containing protein [Alphaproteobacteria bacterium]
LQEQGVMSIRSLAKQLNGVSEVTVRRDVNRLAKRGLLKRTHGGVVRVDDVDEFDLLAPSIGDSTESVDFQTFDAIILSPVEGRGAMALRKQIKRMPVPFIAESAPQEGGIYLGPNNWAAGYALGCVAGRDCQTDEPANVLLISHEALPNTVARADGFINGLKDTLGAIAKIVRVDGEGEYRFAYSAAKDAFQAHPEINLIFGVNDHSILAGMEASDICAMDAVRAYSVGGEGDEILAALTQNKILHACAALFPEIVGRKAIDLIAFALEGHALPDEVFTPFEILTAKNLPDFYRLRDGKFALRQDVIAKIDPGPDVPPLSVQNKRPSVNFMPHFPAHDWYRNMTRAMQERADALGFNLVVSAPQAGIAREIVRLRSVIAKRAAKQIMPDETILLAAGETTLLLAKEICGRPDLTVVTNSFEILKLLAGPNNPKVILTGGEYQEKDRCLVGPSLASLFEMMRVDRAFLSINGISPRFGLSATDERIARALQRFISAARTTCVLADHTLVGFDANHRIAQVDGVAELITDSGTLASHRLAFAEAGVRVILADDEEISETLPPVQPGQSEILNKYGHPTEPRCTEVQLLDNS